MPEDPRLASALRSGSFAQTLRVAVRVSGLTLERVRDELAARDVRVSAATLAGLISGTPTARGTFTVTVTATDTGGASGHTSFTYQVL
jgi:hypothetical protein